MNHEIYKKQIDILILKASELSKQIDIVDNDKKLLRESYIEFLKQENNLQIGDRVKYHGTLCWIYDFKLNYFNNKLVARLKKVKKDGTNGERIAHSYGTNVEDLKRITNE